MARYEVTWRALGPVRHGSRVEACVTFPVKVPDSRRDLGHQEAIEASYMDWEDLLDVLRAAAAGRRFEVSVEAREL